MARSRANLILGLRATSTGYPKYSEPRILAAAASDKKSR
jgi:hypothetical protein